MSSHGPNTPLSVGGFRSLRFVVVVVVVVVVEVAEVVQVVASAEPADALPEAHSRSALTMRTHGKHSRESALTTCGGTHRGVPMLTTGSARTNCPRCAPTTPDLRRFTLGRVGP